MGNEVSTSSQPPTLRSLINSDKMGDQFQNAFPTAGLSDSEARQAVTRFQRVALTCINRVPKLLECTQASVMECLLDCASMGIEPDNRRAYLIPYGKKCTLIISYMGYVELLRRSGVVSKIHADVVCENDVFEHEMGEVTKHSFDLKTGRGEPYAAYCQVTMKDGSKQAAIMSKEEIEKIRKGSRAGNSGPWVDHWNEMAKKTAVRRVVKLLPLSADDFVRIEKDREYATIRETQGSGGGNPMITGAFPQPPESTQNPAEKPEDDGKTIDIPSDSDESDDEKPVKILEVEEKEGQYLIQVEHEGDKINLTATEQIGTDASFLSGGEALARWDKSLNLISIRG